MLNSNFLISFFALFFSQIQTDLLQKNPLWFEENSKLTLTEIPWITIVEDHNDQDDESGKDDEDFEGEDEEDDDENEKIKKLHKYDFKLLTKPPKKNKKKKKYMLRDKQKSKNCSKKLHK